MKKLPPHADLVAGDAFRNSLLSRADIKEPFPMWHGWALMEAFLAGAEYARSRQPEGVGVTISREMLNFLHGCGTLEEVWFGDEHPAHHGVFWWRRKLPPVESPQHQVVQEDK